MRKSSQSAVSAPLSRGTIALALALLTSPGLEAQAFVEQPGATRAPEYIWTLVESVETDPADPAGTLFRNGRDFLLCGARAQNAPAPAGSVTIRYENEDSNDVAEFNNATVDLLREASVEDRELLEVALARFTAGLQADPIFLPFVYNRARVLAILGRPGEAREAFRKAANLLPTDSGIQLQMGQMHQALGDFIAAGYAFRKAATLNPVSLQAFLSLGHLARTRGQPALARRYYEAVLDRLGDHAEALYGLAALERLEGQDRAALRILLRFDPHELDGTWREDYNLRWHLNLGELCYDLRNFACAAENLARLLEQPEDEIFLEIRPSYVRGRLERIEAIRTDESQ